MGTASEEPDPGSEERPYALSSEPGCVRGLKWSLEAVGDEELVRRSANELTALGFRETSPEFARGKFLSFRHVSGHEIVMVPRTGRIQIRLDPSTQNDERRRQAESVAALVGKALDRARREG